MSEPANCAEHRTHLAALDRRIAVLETVIGTTAEDGLRGLMCRLNDQLADLNANVQALQLAQAKAAGAVEGASWLGRLVWAVLGGAISAAVVGLLRP